MATSGPNSAGSGANVASGYIFDWINPGNITTSNNVYATATSSGADGTLSKYLAATNFGFALDPNDKVTSILVEYECKVSAQRSGTPDHLVYWTLNGTNIVNGAIGEAKFPISEGYNSTTINNYSSYGIYITGTEANASTFGVMFIVYGDGAGNTYSIDHVRITLTYQPAVYKTQSDLVSSVTETISKETISYPYVVSNNNQAYVLNLKTRAWSFISTAPYSNVIYRPEAKTMLAAMRSTGNICTLDASTSAYTVSWIVRTGFYSFSQLDEMKEMPDDASQALKRLRKMYADVKATGNITLTVFTEQDSTGKTFTITPETTDYVVYNRVRTTLSRDIRGKFISFQFSGTCRAWVGDTIVTIGPRALR